MGVNWKDYCGAVGFKCLGNEIDVTLDNNRRQKIYIEENSEGYQLSSFVAKQSIVRSIPDACLRAWRRNRSVMLVGFRVDDKGRMVGECHVPKPGLTAEEFRLYVTVLAVQCDRFEHQLTGRDI